MTGVWNDMFLLGLPVLEKILRPVAVYAILVFVLRIGGKRELAQLNPPDFVVLLTLSNTVQNAIIGDDNSVTGAFIGALTLILVNHLLVRFAFDKPKLERIIEGSPEILIDNGVLDARALTKNLLTPSELEMAAHRHGFQTLDEIQRAVIEPGGNLHFVRKESLSDMARYQALLDRLDRLSADVRALRAN